MSLSFGAVLIESTVAPPEELLQQLGLTRFRAAGQISLNDATRSDFVDTAIGYYRQRTIVIDRLLPYDCSYQPGELSALDLRLVELSAAGLVMCFYLDGRTGSSGFTLFWDGQRIRRRAVDPVHLSIDEGEPLPAEQDFAASSRNDETRIFALSAVVLDEPLDTLIFMKEVELQVYAES